jgi:hypothetical protein
MQLVNTDAVPLVPVQRPRGEEHEITTPAINHALPHPPRAPNLAPVRKTPAIGR